MEHIKMIKMFNDCRYIKFDKITGTSGEYAGKKLNGKKNFLKYHEKVHKPIRMELCAMFGWGDKVKNVMEAIGKIKIAKGNLSSNTVLLRRL
jgi:hypothetical protein